MPRRNVLVVVGTRPNFVKSAPLMRELRAHDGELSTLLLHTGQHYDPNLSQWLFDDLGLTPPDISLQTGSGSHIEQIAKVMLGLEEAIAANRSDLVVVFGDVNSTVAAAIVASKAGVKLAHVESGLRSFDRTMPEEINRVVTDHLSDLLFVSEESGLKNLEKEGIPSDRIFYSGNIMIDSLLATRATVMNSDVMRKLGLAPREYALLTLHRPSNVDSAESLTSAMNIIEEVSQKIPVVFPCHPRTRNNLAKYRIQIAANNDVLKIIEPVGYIDFCRLIYDSKFVMTDSGGIQEETTFLNIPCITMRDNTERPATVTIGTNVMTGVDRIRILEAVDSILNGTQKHGRIPDLWDGHAAERIVEVLKAYAC